MIHTDNERLNFLERCGVEWYTDLPVGGHEHTLKFMDICGKGAYVDVSRAKTLRDTIDAAIEAERKTKDNHGTN